MGGELLGYVSLLECVDMQEKALGMANKMKKKARRWDYTTLHSTILLYYKTGLSSALPTR